MASSKNARSWRWLAVFYSYMLALGITFLAVLFTLLFSTYRRRLARTKLSQLSGGKRILLQSLDITALVLQVVAIVFWDVAFVVSTAMDRLANYWAIILMFVVSATFFALKLPERRRNSTDAWTPDASPRSPDTLFLRSESSEDLFETRSLVYTRSDRVKAWFADLRRKIAGRKMVFWSVIISILAVSILVCMSMEGFCLAGHPNEISTRMTRRYMDPACGAKICHLYLTGTEDMSTSMIVNFHTKEDGKPFAVIAPALGGDRKTYQGMCVDKNDIDEPRRVCWVDLTGLDPDTAYKFYAGVGDGITTDAHSFRTLPHSSTVRFVAGGDMGITSSAQTLMGLAAGKEPLFGLVGGDVTYDNNFPACYRRMDAWLDMWQKYMVGKDNRMIPLVTAIGNHETGGEAGAPPSHVHFWLPYFPQRTGLYNTDIADREVIGAHTIGTDAVLLRLDTGHVMSMASQHDFIAEQLGSVHADKSVKMALYHRPLYPSVRPYAGAADVRENFGTLFDKYHLDIGFENHDHSYKRSYFLREEKKVDKGEGTLYVGDGAWGADPRPLGKKNEWYEAVHLEQNFVLLVDIEGKKVNIRAYGTDGKAMDTVDVDASY